MARPSQRCKVAADSVGMPLSLWLYRVTTLTQVCRRSLLSLVVPSRSPKKYLSHCIPACVSPRDGGWQPGFVKTRNPLHLLPWEPACFLASSSAPLSTSPAREAPGSKAEGRPCRSEKMSYTGTRHFHVSVTHASLVSLLLLAIARPRKVDFS
jgi:hypothetical protein